MLRVSCRQRLCLAKGHVPDRPAGMHPCIDTPWARLKEKRPHFLPGIALVIEEEKEERICHGSETGFASTTIASLARFLADMVVIPIGMIRQSKRHKSLCKLCLIQACQGTECTRMMLELLI